MRGIVEILFRILNLDDKIRKYFNTHDNGQIEWNKLRGKYLK
jgi:hypothetical protein